MRCIGFADKTPFYPFPQNLHFSFCATGFAPLGFQSSLEDSWAPVDSCIPLCMCWWAKILNFCSQFLCAADVSKVLTIFLDIVQEYLRSPLPKPKRWRLLPFSCTPKDQQAQWQSHCFCCTVGPQSSPMALWLHTPTLYCRAISRWRASKASSPACPKQLQETVSFT